MDNSIYCIYLSADSPSLSYVLFSRFKLIDGILHHTNSPWYTDELRREKHNRRRAERTWLRTGLVVHRQVYRAQCVVVNCMLHAAKRIYCDKIASCGSNPKQLFNITKSLIGVSCNAKLPSYASSNDQAQRFSNQFEKKVSDIQQSIAHRSGDRSNAFSDDSAFRGAQSTRFTGVSDSDVSKLIAGSLCKSCGQDPLPTCLLKLCSSELVAMITAVINSSLESSTVPDAFKQAVVRQLQHSVGITDAALSWLHSYITERYQRVAVDSATSADYHEMWRVTRVSTWTNSILHIHETHR